MAEGLIYAVHDGLAQFGIASRRVAQNKRMSWMASFWPKAGVGSPLAVMRTRLRYRRNCGCGAKWKPAGWRCQNPPVAGRAAGGFGGGQQGEMLALGAQGLVRN